MTTWDGVTGTNDMIPYTEWQNMATYIKTGSGYGANLVIYTDGVAGTSTTWTGNAAYTASNLVRIGCNNLNAGGGDIQNWNGSLDEVCIFGRALTSTEVTSLYNSGNGFQYPFSSSILSSSMIAFLTGGI